MTYRVVPTESFEREYVSVVRYLVEVLHARQGARRLVDGIEKLKMRLSDNPRISAISNKSILGNLELREAFVRGYVIVYRIAGEIVYLEHIFHQKQDFEKLV